MQETLCFSCRCTRELQSNLSTQEQPESCGVYICFLKLCFFSQTQSTKTSSAERFPCVFYGEISQPLSVSLLRMGRICSFGDRGQNETALQNMA